MLLRPKSVFFYTNLDFKPNKSLKEFVPKTNFMNIFSFLVVIYKCGRHTLSSIKSHRNDNCVVFLKFANYKLKYLGTIPHIQGALQKH